MPPRVSCSAITSSTSSLWQISSAAAKAPHQQQISAAFSTSASRSYNSKNRRFFWKWLSKDGRQLRRPSLQGGTNYVFSKTNPFPLNPQFKATPILADSARELIWNKVISKGESIKSVSAELGVSIPRVAAIVRLKEVEKDWVAKGKKMAIPYAQAIEHMVPSREFTPGQQNEPFENINEIHVHPHTTKQLFWPVSESRHFTREDAAKAFHRDMLSADKRVPHPELTQMERDLAAGMSFPEAKARFSKAATESERKAAEAQRKKFQEEARATSSFNTKRFEFRFKEINAEDVGADGRKPTAVGARYGRPSYDRAKGAIKIPTSVP